MNREQMHEITKRVVDEFKTEELVLDHGDNYYIKGTTEDLESAVRLALTEVWNEAIKECEWNIGAFIEEADFARKVGEKTGNAEAVYAVQDIVKQIKEHINTPAESRHYKR